MNHPEVQTNSIEFAAEEDPLPDLLNNRFQITETIIETPNSIVCSGEDLQRESSKVAVKVFKDSNPSQVHRHTVEMALCEQIEHPNIISSIGRGSVMLAGGEARFMAMPFASEGTLAKLYNQPGSAEEKSVISLLRDTAAGLEELHAQGLVHRDIKPANILIDRTKGEELGARIGDLGIVAPAGAINGINTQDPAVERALEEVVRREKRSSSPGSDAYVAPEQMLGKAVPKSDVYALGRSFLRLVGVGNFADKGYFIDELGNIHPHHPPEQIPIPKLPHKLAQLIRQTQKVSPSERPSASEIVQATSL